MKHSTTPFMVISALMLISVKSWSQPPQITSNVKNVPVIELHGNGYERGLQHGKMLKAEIADVYKKWKKDIEADMHKNADSVIDDFCHATNFEPAIKKWTPELYDEIKGIADGSGQPFKDVYTYQLADEFWVYIDKVKHPEANHCSGVGVAASGSNPAYVAQNLDAPTFMNGSQVLLHIRASKTEPEQFVLSGAGLIGMNGVNEKGIGLTVNTVLQLDANTDGLPVACVVRGILVKKDRQSALQFIQTVKHSSGQNYILGTVDSVYDFEASSSKVVRYIPNPANPGIVYHTNHPVANDDIKPGWEKYKVSNNSSTRLAALQTRVTEDHSSENIVKEALRSKDSEKYPVCVAYQKDKAVFTFSSVIYTLGKNPAVQITNGSPDLADYVLVKFTHGK